MKIVHHFFILSCLSVIFFLAPLNSLYSKELSNFFDTSLGDFQEELEIAQEENKKGLILFFEMDECPFCHWMKTNVLNKKEVQDSFKKDFKIFAIDIEGDIEITDFNGNETTQKEFAFKQFRVRATPVIAFFDLKGKLMTKYTGRTSSVKEFKLLGKYILSGGYKKMKFSKYKRQKR